VSSRGPRSKCRPAEGNFYGQTCLSHELGFAVRSKKGAKGAISTYILFFTCHSSNAGPSRPDEAALSDASSVSTAQLNSFLRGEISAVEAYNDLLQRVTDPGTRAALHDCALSHQQRVRQLRVLITSVDCSPSDGSGAWGAFTRLVGGAARAFGDRAAVSALVRGEDKGLHDYRDRVWKLDSRGKAVVEHLLLPAQEQTSRAVRGLQKNLG
jgi:uncharacterized protein DUF2383